MRIGIDARLLEETGVGRYIRNLIGEISELDKKNEYAVFLSKKSYAQCILPNSRWKKVLADVRWHTLKEQWIMPRLFRSANLDLVHIPYHNPPIFYSGPMIVTIHDLTILHFNTGKATTLPQPLYQLKRLGYWVELCIGLKKSRRIIAVSETTKRELIDHFRVPARKIIVTYEGVNMKRSDTRALIDAPYLLYVGNAYPHKNLENLIAATQKLKKKLVLVGNDDFFYRRLRSKMSDNVVFFGPASDEKLSNLYQHADALVSPSLMEGFGLPALEALSFGCPVLASNIPIFHEILGEYASYFNPTDPKSIAKAVSGIQKKRIPPDFFARYSWQHMASETLQIYEGSTCI